MRQIPKFQNSSPRVAGECSLQPILTGARQDINRGPQLGPECPGRPGAPAGCWRSPAPPVLGVPVVTCPKDLPSPLPHTSPWRAGSQLWGGPSVRTSQMKNKSLMYLLHKSRSVFCQSVLTLHLLYVLCCAPKARKACACGPRARAPDSPLDRRGWCGAEMRGRAGPGLGPGLGLVRGALWAAPGRGQGDGWLWAMKHG